MVLLMVMLGELCFLITFSFYKILFQKVFKKTFFKHKNKIGFISTNDEVNSREEEHVKEEVSWTGNDEGPSVDDLCKFKVFSEVGEDEGMPHAHCAENCHRYEDVLVLKQALILKWIANAKNKNQYLQIYIFNY